MTSDASPVGATFPNGRRDAPILLAIAALAVLARALPVLRGGGLTGYLGYDDGVYFSAAVAFVHGVLPYRDFLFLHPPGIVLSLAPFAALGGVASDATAMAVARVAFWVLGAVSACVAAAVAGRFDRRAGIAAGVIYAVWLSASYSERDTTLPGPQNALLLLALLVLARARPTPRTGLAVGALLGLAMSVQLWQAVALAIVVATLALGERVAIRDRVRRAGAAVVGAVIAFALVLGPFVLAAPERVFRYILFDQLGRPPLAVTLKRRLVELEGLPNGSGTLPAPPLAVLIAIAAGVVLLAIVVAWRVRPARPWVAILLVEATYLVLAPVFYPHYAAWTAPVAALVLGTGFGLVAQAVERRRRAPGGGSAAAGAAARPFERVGGLPTLVAIVLAAALAVPSVGSRDGFRVNRAALRHAIAGARCIASDGPALLVLTGALRTDLAQRCPLVLDPTGVSYDADRGSLPPGRFYPSRQAQPGYQAAMLAWYSGGTATMLVRLGPDGLTDATLAAIRARLPVETKIGPIRVLTATRVVD